MVLLGALRARLKTSPGMIKNNGLEPQRRGFVPRSKGVIRRFNRIVEPPVNNQPRTFDPYAVGQAEYDDLRRRGYVPKVVVEGAPVTSKSDSFDLNEYMRQRKSMERRHEMDDFLDSRLTEMEKHKKSRTADMDAYLAARQRGETPV